MITDAPTACGVDFVAYESPSIPNWGLKEYLNKNL